MVYFKMFKELTQRFSDMKKPEQYGNWIYNSLTNFYDNSKPWDELTALVSLTSAETPSDAFSRVYSDCVLPCSRENFNQGIGVVLNKYSKISDDNIFKPIKDLVFLVGRTNAVEAFDGLLDVNSAEFITKNYDEIFGDTFANIGGMKPKKSVYDFTRKLVNTPFFHNGYIFSAIDILIDDRSENPIKLIDKFGERIQEHYNSVKDNEGEKSAYWEAVDFYFSRHLEIVERIKVFSRD